jgi:hypothetical protein
VYCLSVLVSVKKEQGIASHFISEIGHNGTTELNGDILFFVYAYLDASFTRIKIDEFVKSLNSVTPAKAGV